MITGVCFPGPCFQGEGRCSAVPSRTFPECFRGESPAAAPCWRAFPAGTALGDPADKESFVRIQTPAPREPRELSTSAGCTKKRFIRVDTAAPVRDTLTFPLPGEGI